MNLEERKNMVYTTLRMHNKLTHNDLWREIQREFEKKKDSFSNKTFEKTLKSLVGQGLAYREKDRKSKLGKIWYFPVINFPQIESDVMNNLETKIDVYNGQLRVFEKKFNKYDMYEKARRLGRFYILNSLLEHSIEWFSEVYHNNPKMKQRKNEVANMKKRLDKLFQKSKTDRDEIRQLVVKGFESDEQEILNEIYDKDWLK